MTFQRRAYEAGVTPDQYWDYSFAEVSLMIGGYNDRQKVAWLQTREIAYMIYCLGSDNKNRMSIEKFMPMQSAASAEKHLSKAEQLKQAKIKWEKLRPRK